MIYNGTQKEKSVWFLYTVHTIICCIFSTVISTVFIYFYWYSKKILPMPITNINDKFRGDQLFF